MKRRAAHAFFHAFAGLTIGLVCYAIYLLALVHFGVAPTRTAYWLIPVPNTADFDRNVYRLNHLHMLWQFNRIELVAVLVGLLIPLFFAILGGWWAGKRPLAWLPRWYVQLTFCILSVFALVCIVSLVSFIIPLPL